ncbi:MAG: hypothetical protein QM756_11960 [Polyangiaceae bacterium]
MATEPVNEPVLTYAPGSRERAALREEIARQSSGPRRLLLRVGAAEFDSPHSQAVRAPHRHALELANAALASRTQVQQAIDAALSAQGAWAERDLASRGAIFGAPPRWQPGLGGSGSMRPPCSVRARHRTKPRSTRPASSSTFCASTFTLPSAWRRSG